jgi:hypothetical protein
MFEIDVLESNGFTVVVVEGKKKGVRVKVQQTLVERKEKDES